MRLVNPYLWTANLGILQQNIPLYAHSSRRLMYKARMPFMNPTSVHEAGNSIVSEAGGSTSGFVIIYDARINESTRELPILVFKSEIEIPS